MKRPICALQSALAFALLMTACGSPSSSSDARQSETNGVESDPQQPGTNPNLVLGTFSELPPEVEGCTCYFATSDTTYARKQFVFGSDYSETAFAVVNDKLVEFSLESSTQPAEGQQVDRWRGGSHTLIVNTKELRKIDETQQYTGTLILQSVNGKSVIKSVLGECGC